MERNEAPRKGFIDINLNRRMYFRGKPSSKDMKHNITYEIQEIMSGTFSVRPVGL